jgi:riboflavin synthase
MNKMFTGIIEEIGSIKNIAQHGPGKTFEIEANKIVEDLKIDQSVAVNGVCLTVVEIGKDSFFADAVAETLAKSTLMQLKKNDAVNLERALRLQDRLGGHLVQGHVDAVGIIASLKNETGRSTLVIKIPFELQHYSISKGSIAIDGVSFTNAEKKENFITIAVIPHTMSHTIFQFKKTGDSVNVEVDFFAKYIEQFMSKTGETKISSGWLKQQGF